MIDPDPNRTRPIVLSQYRDLPAEHQPTIYVYAPRRRTSGRLAELLDQLQRLDSSSSLAAADQVMRDLTEAVRSMLAHWRGMSDERGEVVEFDPARLEDVLSDGDVAELAAEIYQLGMLSSAEKKASASPSTSPGTTPPSSTSDSTSSVPNVTGTETDAPCATTAASASPPPSSTTG